jgi:ribosomal protein L10
MTLVQKKSQHYRELFYKENLYKHFNNNKYLLFCYVNNIKLTDWNNLQDELKGKIINLESQRIKNSFTFRFLNFSGLQDKVCSFNGPSCIFFFNNLEDCFTLLNTIEKSKASTSKFLPLGIFSDKESYDIVKLNELKTLDKSVHHSLFNKLEFCSR